MVSEFSNDNVDNFISRLQNLCLNFKIIGESFLEARRIGHLVAKMNAPFPAETAQLRRDRDMGALDLGPRCHHLFRS